MAGKSDAVPFKKKKKSRCAGAAHLLQVLVSLSQRQTIAQSNLSDGKFRMPENRRRRGKQWEKEVRPEDEIAEILRSTASPAKLIAYDSGASPADRCRELNELTQGAGLRICLPSGLPVKWNFCQRERVVAWE